MSLKSFKQLFSLLACTAGGVRLTGGVTAMDGLVDVCLNGTYSSVCITGWSVDEASVVCRQLGFPTGWATGNMCTRIEKQFICITTLSFFKVIFLMTVLYSCLTACSY